MTGKVAEHLAKVIKNNSNLKKLSLENNMLGPSLLFILQALKCNSKLEALNLSGNNFTGQVAEELADVIKNNSGLNKLYLSDCKLKLFVNVILEHISQLKCLHLDNNNLLDVELTAIVQVIKSSSLIFDLCLGDNMLQSGLIDIVISCSSLTNLQVLELSHNSISATKVVCLASSVAKISSLEVLMSDGLVLSAKERYCFDICQIYNASRQKFVLQDCNNNELLEITCFEMWRSQFVHSIRFKYTHRSCFSAAIMAMKTILFDTEYHLSTILLIAKQSEQKLLQLDAKNVIMSLSRTIKMLKVLDLGHSNIKEEAAVKLATALNCNNVLEQLWLRGNVLGTDGAAVILSSLQNITTLRVLDLSYNNISSTSANGIAAVINSNHFLEQLWLDGNMLMTTGVVIIASALKKHSNLRLLSLSNNEITEDAAEEISAIANSNTLLGGLLLSNNSLQSVGICTIVKSLTGIKYLHILELTNNSIEDSNPEQLSLDDTEILPLQKSKLGLYYSKMTLAEELAVTLSQFSCLKELYLGSSNLKTTGAIKICRVLKTLSSLQALSLNNNNITTEAASEICNVIKANTILDILLLGGNDLQTSGVIQIADTVKNNNPSMQLLSLSDNNVDEQVKEDIKVMLCDLELFM